MRVLLVLLVIGVLPVVAVERFQPETTVADLLPGLKKETFTGSWEWVSQMLAEQPKGSSVASAVALSDGDRRERVGVRFSGYLFVRTSGTYTFGIESDDGSQIRLCDRVLVDNDGLHGAQTKEEVVQLERGLYPITVLWFNLGGGAVLRARWSGSKESGQAIGGADLYHVPAAVADSQRADLLSMADLGLAPPPKDASPAVTGSGDKRPGGAEVPATVVIDDPMFGGLEMAIGGGVILLLLLIFFWRMLRNDASDLDEFADHLERGSRRRRTRR